MKHSRRAFLASAVTGLPAAMAGCTSIADSSGEEKSPRRTEAEGNPPPAARLQMAAVQNAEIGRRHVLSLREYPDECRRVVERTVENGSMTVDAESPPLWRDERPFLYDGGVYRLSYDVRNERPATRYFWDLTPVERAAEDEIVQFGDLPRLDREKFRLVGLGDDAVGEDTPLDVGMTFVYANTDRNQSALVPTPDRLVVEWESSRRARFSIRNSNSKDATLKTYRYTAERIAPTVGAYGRHLRDRYAFELSGLADAERELVTRAIEHGYTVERGDSPSDAFSSLVDEFRRHEAVTTGEDGVSGDYLTTYDGQVYWTELRDGHDAGGETTTTKQ
ncbi:hypothetical protein [Haladaptatus sp. NG-WS-4]